MPGRNISDWGCAYLKKVVESGIHQWTFKLWLLNTRHYFMTIGVFKTKNATKMQKGRILHNFGDNEGHGWIVNYRNLINNELYGTRECKTGDVITMTLDLKEFTLRYSIE